jgi:hypothetical protein
MYDPEIVELVNASRAMLDGKNWHEIDGSCSICIRFRKAVEIAENAAEQYVQSDVCHTCKRKWLSPDERFCPHCGTRR